MIDRSRSLVFALALLAAVSAASFEARGQMLSRVEPAAVGMDGAHLARINAAVAAGLAEGQMAGCVVLVGRGGHVCWLQAYGHRSIEPEHVAMTVDTVFDMASLTKPVATATSVMLLVDRGQVRLGERVAAYLPEFAAAGKDEITVQQLLTHTGGLIPDNALTDYADGVEKAWERICALEPQSPPGERFAYTDVGFIVLGKLVERVSGRPLDQFARENIFAPLGMADTVYCPSESLRARAAATEQRDGRWMQGDVHDPRAFALGGVAGHAGLFSTAEDLAIYAQTLLDGGRRGDARIMGPRAVELMRTPLEVPRGRRGLGWDMRTGYSTNRGELMTDQAFGHGGFTGTAMWIDPGLDLFVVFLSNRLHPDGKGEVNRLAGRIGSIAAAAIRTTTPPPLDADGRAAAAPPEPRAAGNALAGIDVLVRDGFAQLRGERVGLITNHTGRARDGRSTIELLAAAPDVDLVALYSPEHGIAGRLDIPQIGDSSDDRTGLPVISLYGKNRRPTAESLAGVDALVFDIQDIGTRFYTYVSTMGECLQSAAEHGKRFVVLDRPNPIGGMLVEGPLLERGSESFVGFHALPVRHGMTVGELAAMFKQELGLEVELQIVRVEGWRRGDYFDATGLTWINPSPNMRSLAEATLYPGVGLLETTNVSVGRGTDAPFEVLGAPWIDGPRLAAELNAAGLGGVRFVPIEFTPRESKFAGERCCGVNIIVTDRGAFAPVRTGLALALALGRLHPDDWNVEGFNRLLANRAVHESVARGDALESIEAGYRPQLAEFLQRRERFLLYP